ncbi:MAG TPA: FtsX-like permease family protein, partial [Thermoplasmata archaeon]|nr:FtsX-like permease family protein [Thermoplasmata archaeon]
MRDILIPTIAIAGVAVAIGLLAGSHRVLARMAVRNAFRRRSRVLLVTFGLLIGTMIVSSSLSIGDTLEYIFTGDVYDRLDAVDVTVTHEANGQLFDFPESYFFDLRNESVQRGIAFDGMAPALQKEMPVRNGLTGNQAITVMGLEDAYEAGFGDLVDTAGGAVGVAALPPDAVYVNEAAARDLNASVGNRILLFWGNSASEVKNVSVHDIVRDVGKGTYGHLSIVFAPLASAQGWFNATGRIDVIRVSAPGPAVGGELQSAQLASDLRRLVVSNGWNVGVHDAKGDALREAQTIADQATELFLVMGSFAIFAGILLIVNVFVMLAEERKAEMGVSRAVGMKRVHVTLAFLFEGSLYVAMAAAAGALAGVGLGWLMVQIFNTVFPASAGQSFLVFHVEVGSLVL